MVPLASVSSDFFCDLVHRQTRPAEPYPKNIVLASSRAEDRVTLMQTAAHDCIQRHRIILRRPATFLRDVTWTQWRRILCSEGSHFSRQLSQLIPMTDFTLDSSPSWKSSTHGSFFHPLPLDTFRELDDSSVLAPCALPQIFCCSDSARALCPQAGAFDSSTRVIEFADSMLCDGMLFDESSLFWWRAISRGSD